MQIAAILSDLTSLRVCDHSAALALVSVHKASTHTATDTTNAREDEGESDKDMQRATALVDLHYGVKEKYARGEEEELRRARRDVDVVLERLERRRRRRRSGV